MYVSYLLIKARKKKPTRNDAKKEKKKKNSKSLQFAAFLIYKFSDSESEKYPEVKISGEIGRETEEFLLNKGGW